jgi:transketolase
MSDESAAKRVKLDKEEMDVKCIDTVRVLSADIVEKANSGHPGAPMGCAPIAHVLFGETMNFSPSNPSWSNRDRFVLSNGHACALQYSMLHLCGYDLSIDDLKKFRQLGSLTPGHPENIVTPGVEVSTGPLGQGISNAVGMAIAEKHLAATFNRGPAFGGVVDHYTYVICGDGCLQEGISSEACSLAGHLQLGKLIVCYDDNLITIDGNTALSFTEDVNMRYEAYGWHVQTVADVNDLVALRASIAAAKAETNRPSIIKIRTVIGHGSKKGGTSGVHGAPLGKDDLANVKTKFGFDPSLSFEVSADVKAHYSAKVTVGKEHDKQWTAMFAEYAKAFPELAAEFVRREKGELPAGWKDNMPLYSPAEAKAAATRNRSEEVLNYVAGMCPEILGGSADLSPSNLTVLKCSGDFQGATPGGRYIRFGVREHAMAAISNGIFAHGLLRPFCATFLNFIGYAMGAVRVSALSEFGIIYIMTHDSIGLGEDGPTHQPVELLAALRAMPNLYTLRPCDGNETKGAYIIGMEAKKTPTVISLSRQGAPTLEGSCAEKTLKGGYVLREIGSSSSSAYPTLTIVATGTEVSLAVKSAEAISANRGNCWVRVVSLPCTELFDKQPLDYQKSVFVNGSPVLSVEAGGVAGWRGKYAHACVGMQDCFGYSAPGDDLMNHFGFTLANVVEKGEAVVDFYSREGGVCVAPSLLDYPRFAAPGPLH